MIVEDVEEEVGKDADGELEVREGVPADDARQEEVREERLDGEVPGGREARSPRKEVGKRAASAALLRSNK